jgi:hypothetical protein
LVDILRGCCILDPAFVITENASLKGGAAGKFAIVILIVVPVGPRHFNIASNDKLETKGGIRQ